MSTRKTCYSALNPGSRLLLTRISDFRNILRPPAPRPRYVLIEDQQQCRDGDQGDRRRDEDGAGGTGDVDVVLAGDDKYVCRDRERSAEQPRGCPEWIDVEEKAGRKIEGRRVDRELHEGHVGDLGRPACDLASCQGRAKGEERAGACGAAEQIEEVGHGLWRGQAGGGEGQAGEDGEDQGVSRQGVEGSSRRGEETFK